MTVRDSLFLDPPSIHDIKLVLKKMEDPESKWYFPIVSDEDDKLSIYIEPDQSGVYTGVGRVFTSISDIETYLKHIAITGKHPSSNLKSYEVRIKKAYEHIHRIKNSHMLPLKFVVSLIEEAGLVDVCLFWDGRAN